ncbi:putative MAPEG superfamily protein [Hyphomicrobiales bacterium]|nr:putative MAPEG superfamily protein [Hyphomicrobiales bacterium]CAH1699369.1 Putative MAPEG superfamily protein [Hyphomicrobiales bacterium]CAI0343157.1 putative MAPEG superfamily protein [Hyphomicrobiales bacterium]
MNAIAATTEITVLGWSVVLLLVQIVLQAGTAADLGPKYLFSPRDEGLQSGNLVSQRLKRALDNLLESYPAFVALALALAVTGKAGGIAATGAWLYLLARIVYVALYAAGVPVIRTFVWLASIIGLVMMLVRLMS